MRMRWIRRCESYGFPIQLKVCVVFTRVPSFSDRARSYTCPAEFLRCQSEEYLAHRGKDGRGRHTDLEIAGRLLL